MEMRWIENQYKQAIFLSTLVPGTLTLYSSDEYSLVRDLILKVLFRFLRFLDKSGRYGRIKPKDQNTGQHGKENKKKGGQKI